MSGIETVGTENDARHEDDENSGNRSAWEVLSWIAVVLTIVLNLVLVAVIAFRRTFNSVANKGDFFKFSFCNLVPDTCLSTFAPALRIRVFCLLFVQSY